MKQYSSIARYTIVPSITDARAVVYNEKPKEAQMVFSQLYSISMNSNKTIRKGKLFDFDVSINSKNDSIRINHPKYGMVRFQSRIQFVAWMLNEYV